MQQSCVFMVCGSSEIKNRFLKKNFFKQLFKIETRPDGLHADSLSSTAGERIPYLNRMLFQCPSLSIKWLHTVCPVLFTSAGDHSDVRCVVYTLFLLLNQTLTY